MEIVTFVKKFCQLWNAGCTAHLDVDTHAGNAWVGLRVQLGHALGPLHRHPHPPFFQAQKKTVSPSRQLRRARRAAARLTNAEEAVNVETPKDTTIEEIVNVEETVIEEPNALMQHQSIEEVEDIVEVSADKVVAEEASSHQGSLFITDIDDEICDDEKYYDVIDPGISFTCLVCKIVHFPANYVKGDKVNLYAVCRWHLGLSRCWNCAKNLIGLGVIRDHRRPCRAPS